MTIILASVKALLSETNDAAFRAWFKGSKVVDKDGNPLVVYHGSGTDIHAFDYKFTNQGNDALGSGFYFTTDETQAKGYSTARIHSDTPKLGGEEKPTVVSVYLAIRKPLDTKKKNTLTPLQVRKIIERSPTFDRSLEDFGDVGYEGKAKVLNQAIRAYVDYGETLMQALFALANDWYRNDTMAFNEAVRDILGYDGAVDHVTPTTTHWVAWFPEQIKSIKNKGTFDPKSKNIDE